MRPARHSGTTRLVMLMLVGQLLMHSLGCSSFMASHKSNKWMWWKRESEPQAPTKLTPIWTDTVLYQSGLAPVRGFGGRVMFFDGKSETPIQVEGTLTVYAFDGTSPDSSGTIPERKFVFPAEELETHYSESKLGASYSFWLPWDEVGGAERRITLISRFEPTTGSPAMSQPSRHYLPGLPSPEAMGLAENKNKKHPADSNPPDSRHAVQAASFTDAPIDPTIYPRMSTVTIDVPPNFVKHTQGKSLEDLRRQFGRLDVADVGRHRSEEEGSNSKANGKSATPWWEQGTTRAEPTDVQKSDPNVGTETARDRGGSETFQRREQIRRQPHRGTWIPSLSPTPRTE